MPNSFNITGWKKKRSVTPYYPKQTTKKGNTDFGVGGDVYLGAGPQVVDDSLDSVHHLQSHLLFLRPWGDVVVEVIDLLV